MYTLVQSFVKHMVARDPLHNCVFFKKKRASLIMSIADCIKLGDDATQLARDLLMHVADKYQNDKALQVYAKQVGVIYDKDNAAAIGADRTALVERAASGIKRTRELMESTAVREVVINQAFGGFWLSEAALARLHALDQTHSVERDNVHLVRIVKEMGDAANGSMEDQKATLVVIEIPDDVEYTIESQYGSEHIAEVHRTWM